MPASSVPGVLVRSEVELEGWGGVVLRGWLWVPEGAGPHPGVAMAHGLSAVREQGLPAYGEALCDAGIAVLAYDHRNLGASDGEPRQLVNPWAQARDLRRALSWLAERDEVDADRLGLWGSSFSGGEVLVLGAVDARVRAVVANVPYLGLPGLTHDDPAAALAELRSGLEDASGQGPADVGDALGPLTLVDDGGPHAGDVLFPTESAATFFAGGDGPTTWRNEVWVQGAFTGDPVWDPSLAVPELGCPALLVAATADELVPIEQVRTVHASSPRTELVELDTGHFGAYEGEPFARGSAAMAAFLRRHLIDGPRAEVRAVVS